MEAKQITRAWKLNAKPGTADEGEHDPFFIVQHSDGTGNMVRADGYRFFTASTEFDAEPEAYLHDEAFYLISEVPAVEVPAAR